MGAILSFGILLQPILAHAEAWEHLCHMVVTVQGPPDEEKIISTLAFWLPVQPARACQHGNDAGSRVWLNSNNFKYMLVSSQAQHTKARRVESVLAEIVDCRRTENTDHMAKMVEIAARKYRKGREANIKGIQHGQKKMIQARLRCRRG